MLDETPRIAGLQRLVRQFRDERVHKVITGNGPCPLSAGFKVLLHVVPFGVLNGQTTDDEDYSQLLNSNECVRLPVFANHGWPYKIENSEGCLCRGELDTEGRTEIYLQSFRNGAFEYAYAESPTLSESHSGGRYIPFGAIEHELRDVLFDILETSQEVGVTPPVFVVLSLTGTKGLRVEHIESPLGNRRAAPIKVGTLPTRECVVKSLDEDADKVLRPMFDEVWRASGWGGSPCPHDQRKRRSG